MFDGNQDTEEIENNKSASGREEETLALITGPKDNPPEQQNTSLYSWRTQFRFPQLPPLQLPQFQCPQFRCPQFLWHPLDFVGGIFMVCSPIYSIPQYFIAASTARSLYIKLGGQSQHNAFVQYVGSSAVAASASLSSLGIYQAIQAYHEGKLSFDALLWLFSFGTALPACFNTVLLASTPWLESHKRSANILKIFSAVCVLISSFGLNIYATTNQYAFFCTNNTDVALEKQLRSLSFHLIGKNEDKLQDILRKLNRIKQEVILEEETFSSNRQEERTEIALENFKESFAAFIDILMERQNNSENTIKAKKAFIKKLSKSFSLWENNSWPHIISGYIYKFLSVSSALPVFYGFYALVTDMFNRISDDDSDGRQYEVIAKSLGTFFGMIPVSVTAAVFTLLWTNLLFKLYHIKDTARNIGFMFEKSPKIVAISMLIFGTIIAWQPLSGIGFHKVVEDFTDFMWDVILPNTQSQGLEELPNFAEVINDIWGILSTFNVCVINYSAMLNGLQFVWSFIQNWIDSDTNEWALFMNKEANKILDKNLPERTVANQIWTTLKNACASSNTEREIEQPLEERTPLRQDSVFNTGFTFFGCIYPPTCISDAFNACAECFNDLSS